MVISDIRKARRRGAYVVEVRGADTKKRYVVSEEFLLSKGFREGDPVDGVKLATIQKEEELSHAKTVCLNYLSVRARSTRELTRRLERDEVSDETQRVVIRWLTDLGYVDDKQFAHDWVTERSRLKKIGVRRLRHELIAKGIDASIIEDALSMRDDRDEYALALQAAEKRIPRLRRVDPDAARRRLYGYLLRRGFDSDIVRKVIRRFFD